MENVAALERQQQALTNAVNPSDGPPSVTLTERAKARGVRIGADGRPVPGAGEADRDRAEVEQILTELNLPDSDRTRTGVEQFARAHGWAGSGGIVTTQEGGRTTSRWGRYRGETNLPFYDRVDTIEVEWDGDEVVGGTITIDGQQQPLDKFSAGEHKRLLAWMSRPGRQTSAS